jgi:hypothetical protein
MPKRGNKVTQNEVKYNKEDKWIVFEGCNHYDGVGIQPYGRLVIDSISMPEQLKETDKFKIEIFKDSQLSQRIAY